MIPQFRSSLRHMLALPRLICKDSAISSRSTASSDVSRRAWILAIERLIPQRIPSEPQVSMNCSRCLSFSVISFQNILKL